MSVLKNSIQDGGNTINYFVLNFQLILLIIALQMFSLTAFERQTLSQVLWKIFLPLAI